MADHCCVGAQLRKVNPEKCHIPWHGPNLEHYFLKSGTLFSEILRKSRNSCKIMDLEKRFSGMVSKMCVLGCCVRSQTRKTLMGGHTRSRPKIAREQNTQNGWSTLVGEKRDVLVFMGQLTGYACSPPFQLWEGLISSVAQPLFCTPNVPL